MNSQFLTGSKRAVTILAALIVFVLLAGLIRPVAADSTLPPEAVSRIEATNNSHWSTEFYARGVNGWVQDLEIGPDGTLYAAGYFYQAGTAQVTGLARWKDNAWQAFGNFSIQFNPGPYTGLGSVDDIAVSGQNIYVGGNFRYYNKYYSMKNVAMWNGFQWSRLGSGIEDPVSALTVSGDGTVYAGTDFGEIYRWDGTNWTLQGTADDGITALAVDSSGTLYAGGYFTTIDSVPVNYIAMKIGGVWQSMNGGSSRSDGGDPIVLDIAIWNGAVYAGGWFDTIGGIASPYLAYWQDDAWQEMNGLDGGVSALKPDGNKLWVGGYMETMGSLPSGNIAAWNGSSWEVLPEQISDQNVRAIAINGPQLYAGGTIFNAGQAGVMHVAQWNGTTWNGLGEGQGASNVVQTMLVSLDQTDLYVGGKFDSIGGTVAHHIARWDGTQWHALGDGFDRDYSGPDIRALLIAEDSLYAGGSFTSSGSTLINNIAQWNGSSWLPLGEGLTYDNGEDGTVYALALDNAGNIYAGGSFQESGGLSLNHVAWWNGSSWQQLGTGLDYSVYALAYDTTNEKLYAAGYDYSYNPSFVGVSVWDGISWQPLGTEPTGGVYALQISADGTLYAGVVFEYGMFPSYGIAYWADNSWHRVSELDISSTISDFEFDAQGGIVVSGYYHNGYPDYDGSITRWDGYRWRHLGGGVWDDDSSERYYGEAYTVDIQNDTTIFVGGEFGRAGSIPSANIASFSLGSVPTMSILTKGLPQNATSYFYWDKVQELFSDADPGDWLTSLVITSLPQHGVLRVDGTPITSLPVYGYEVMVNGDYQVSPVTTQRLSYVPNTDYVGTDTFTWVASDGIFAAEPSAVNLVVHSDNQLPLVTDLTRVMNPTTEVININIATFSPHFVDADGDELNKVKIVSLPEHGTLTYHGDPVFVGDEFDPTDMFFDYEKNTGYTGQDSFQWNGSDGAAYALDPAAYIINITPLLQIYLPLIQR